MLTLWGSVDAESAPAGAIAPAAICSAAVWVRSRCRASRRSDLERCDRSAAWAQVFRTSSSARRCGQLRGIRVYVAGYVARPGSMTVSSLSTVVNALIRSGGPSAAGSFRNVQLRRGREVVTNVDLYELLLKGDRSADRVMQPDDVIYIGPVGPCRWP